MKEPKPTSGRLNPPRHSGPIRRTSEMGMVEAETPLDEAVIAALDVEEIRRVFEEAGKSLGPEDSIDELREKVWSVCNHQDQKLGHDNSRLSHHLSDTGYIIYRILRDMEFQQGFLALISNFFPERFEEALALFTEDSIEQIKLGMQLHDVGKLHPKINELINLERNLSDDEKALTNRHVGSQQIIETLGLTGPDYKLTRDIILGHHGPGLLGADPRDPSLAFLNLNADTTSVEKAAETHPLHVLLGTFVDIFHAMNEYRGYKKRDMLWFSSAREQLEDDFRPEGYDESNGKFKNRYSIEDELRSKTKLVDPDGHLRYFFLHTLLRLWPSLKMRLRAKTVESAGHRIIEGKNLPEGYGKAA